MNNIYGLFTDFQLTIYWLSVACLLTVNVLSIDCPVTFMSRSPR